MKHRFLLGLAGFGLTIGLLFLAITAAADMTFGNPTVLKTALKNSGAYDTASRELSQRTASAVTSQEGGLPLDKDTVSQVAATSFKPDTIQTSAEEVIDGVYHWLDGQVPSPDFKIDLQPYINNFMQSVGDQATQRAQKLPACTPAQLQQINPAALDINNLPCLPQNISLSQIKDQAIAQATSSNDLLQNPVITVQTLSNPKGKEANPQTNNTQSPFDRASYMPHVFAWLRRAPLIFGGLAAVCILAIIAITWREWRVGVRKISGKFVGAGITLLLLAGATRLSVRFFTQPNGLVDRLAGNDYSAIITTFVRNIEQTLDNTILRFGAYFTVFGIAGLLFWLLSKRLHRPIPTAEPLPVSVGGPTDQTPGQQLMASPTLTPIADKPLENSVSTAEERLDS